MKSLRLFALILALGLTQAYAQQEVAPDHFDSPANGAAGQKAVQKVEHKQVRAQQQRARQHQILAKKHGGKLHSHNTHTAA